MTMSTASPELLSAPPADRARRLLDQVLPAGIGSWIGGRVVLGNGEHVELHDAASGELVTTYQDLGVEGTHELLATARRGAAAWAATDPFERARVLRAVSSHIDAHVDELALLEATTTGKLLRDCMAEASRAAQFFGYYSGWADKILGHTIPVPGNWLTYTQRVPWGVVVAVTPWNAPLFTAAWNAAAPLAAGNSVVIKPSEFTPASTIRLAQLAEEAGLPSGVFSVAVGLGSTVGATLTSDPRVGKVSFIGSVPTGRVVAVAAAKVGTPVVLELGGKSANIVFADADLDRAALGAVTAIFASAGQSCVAGSRLLVERSIHDALVDRIVGLVSKLNVGDPLDERTDVGPIIARSQLRTIRDLVLAGTTDGATQLTGQHLPQHLTEGPLAGGNWVMPTVLDGVTPDDQIENAEVFGPVLGVGVFDTEDEALARANGTAFGLAGAVWTADLARAHRVAGTVRAGTFWINAYRGIHVAVPFGGFGDSGHGRSSGPGAIEEYTQTKAVWVPTAPVASPFPSITF